MIRYEKEVCEYLNLPSIPKKQWDEKKPFKCGVAVVVMRGGEEAYAVAVCDEEVVARIKKTFTIEPFYEIKAIFVVPDYMNIDVDDMDLDDASKEKARAIVEEANDLENEGVAPVAMPTHEYYFEHIHDDEEAIAFIKSYNKQNGIKENTLPKTHEGILMRLSVIYVENNEVKQPRTPKRGGRKKRK